MHECPEDELRELEHDYACLRVTLHNSEDENVRLADEIKRLKDCIQRRIREEAAANQEIERLRLSLSLIAKCKDMTLLGSSDDGCPEKSHQLGAVKAFNQCADIAQSALDT